MPSYGYEYFCGANILVAVENQPVMEVAGISYNLIDSSIPIYGYSSRLFDAVAPGQRIIQGTMAINFVAPDYLFNAILRGRQKSLPFVPVTELTSAQAEANVTLDDINAAAEAAHPDSSAWANLQEGLENKWWGPETGASRYMSMSDPIDMPNINIDIVFGGKYKLTLLSAYFIGRGTALQIDESVIIEEYPFFARDMRTEFLG